MKSGAKKFRSTIAVFLIGAMLGGITAVATGVRRTETIDVTYDNIQIVLDGKTIDPKDALGNKVEPFIYNGTTFLPVRAVGEAFGKEVSWDGTTKTVYIGAKPGEHESWLIQCPPYASHNIGLYKAGENKSFEMSGKTYTEGFTLVDTDGPTSGYATFNLDGKYDSVTFTLGHVDSSGNGGAVFYAYVDGELAFSETIREDYLAKQVTIPLNGALQMKLVVDLGGPGVFVGLADGYFE